MIQERTSGDLTLRPLVEADLQAVVALEKETVGRSRRGYFEKRLAAAIRNPESHIQCAVAGADGALAGYVLARVLAGEFGRESQTCVLEAIGVATQQRYGGVGHLLMEGVEEVMRHKGITTFQTQAEWTNHDVLRFLDSAGFSLAPRQVIEVPVSAAADL